MAKHCEHPNRFLPNPELNMKCCYCGGEFEYEKLPVEGHGPMVPWIYSARRKELVDICPKREG